MKKRITALLLALMLLLAAGAYAETDGTAANAFAEYEQKGYGHGSVSLMDEGAGMVLRVWFNSPDKTDCVLVEGVPSAEENAALEAMDFFDEHYFEKVWDFALTMPKEEVTATSLNDRIPSEEETAAYAGKTVSVLTDEGYSWFTDEETADGLTLLIFHSYETHISYAVDIGLDEPAIADLSDEKIGLQTIQSVRFWGFDD